MSNMSNSSDATEENKWSRGQLTHGLLTHGIPANGMPRLHHGGPRLHQPRTMHGRPHQPRTMHGRPRLHQPRRPTNGNLANGIPHGLQARPPTNGNLANGMARLLQLQIKGGLANASPPFGKHCGAEMAWTGTEMAWTMPCSIGKCMWRGLKKPRRNISRRL